MVNNKGVELLGKIAKSKGYTAYKMAERLGISQTSYKYLKEKAQTVRSDLLVLAQEIAEEEPNAWSLTRFWSELKEEVKKTKFKKAKK